MFALENFIERILQILKVKLIFKVECLFIRSLVINNVVVIYLTTRFSKKKLLRLFSSRKVERERYNIKNVEK